MSEPEVAPYGGLLTRTLEVENEKEAKLNEKRISVHINGVEEVIRPDAIFIRGVDSLSSEDIKAFVEYYVNYDVVVSDTDTVQYEPHSIENQVKFRVQWVNDSAVNIAFEDHEQVVGALQKISTPSSNPNIEKTPEQLADEFSVANNIQERETRPFNPIIAFKKQISLSSRLGILADGASNEEQQNNDEAGKMDEDETSIVLYCRQSFESDKKVKNAATFSRYYLLHGEPERRPRNQYRNRDSQGGRRQRDKNGPKNAKERPVEVEVEEEDLFANRLAGRDRSRSRSRSPSRMQIDREEEDLFASRMRR